jgi:chemotaxis protein CheD
MTAGRRDLNAARTDANVLEVGIGEIVVAEAPARLVTPALGSCVGVIIYDAFAKRGALSHVMLPSPALKGMGGQSGRFADFAVPEMVRLMRDRGSLLSRLEARIAGGAAMFRGDTTIARVGVRNVTEVKRQLELMSIPLVAEDTGEAYARTLELTLQTGEVIVRSYQYGVRRL